MVGRWKGAIIRGWHYMCTLGTTASLYHSLGRRRLPINCGDPAGNSAKSFRQMAKISLQDHDSLCSETLPRMSLAVSCRFLLKAQLETPSIPEYSHPLGSPQLVNSLKGEWGSLKSNLLPGAASSSTCPSCQYCGLRFRV